jgi:Uncharacterized conserved protein
MLAQFSVNVDVWFLDGFALFRNPEMWQLEFFTQMVCLSYEDIMFVIFISVGVVRCGFE